MLAPVSGPPIRAQKPTVRPTARAANPAGTRLSVATAMITNIRAKESSHSTPNAFSGAMLGSVAPSWPTGPRTPSRVSDASAAPAHWATTYGTTSAAGNRRTDQKASVTAGLICAPDRWPRA
jgi:hypothetical protein